MPSAPSPQLHTAPLAVSVPRGLHKARCRFTVLSHVVTDVILGIQQQIRDARLAILLHDGRIGLIDFGQVKLIEPGEQEALAKVMVALAERTGDSNPEDLARIGALAGELGVVLREGAQAEGPDQGMAQGRKLILFSCYC